MSGIVGVFDRTRGVVGPGDLERMHEPLAHRGPDGSGRWRDGRVGLGHQLLATTPEATNDDQPYRDGDLVVTADVRIDNRGELLRRLPVSTPASQVPDSELLVAAYREWGRQCVEQLIGAFAFAIWDASAETLFCARDHVGVKPFYYHRRTDAFAFGSELKALLALPTVPGTVDETKIGDFLTGQFEDETISYYESIERLPPAHAMLVGTDGTERWRYWDLDPTRTITLESDAAYERRFRELFERAVRCRLRTAGSVGTALSGGLDSSSITAVARDLLPADEPLHAFSNVYDEAPASDEREFIETMIDRDGIVSHYVFGDGVGALADSQGLSEFFDKPPHNTLHFARWEKARRGDAVGVDVMLGGALGDSAVGYGLGLLPQLFRTGRWRRLSGELRAMSDVVDAPARSMFVRHALFPMVPDRLRRQYRRLRGRPILEAAANPTLDPAFVDRIGLRSRYKRLDPGKSMLTLTDRQYQYRSLTAGKNVANFETSDLVAAAFGIEPRYPFTDRRLLEFSLAIPPSQRLADGWTRSILRRSLSDLLPEKIRRRPWKTMLNEAFWNALSHERDRLQSLVDEPGPLARYLDIETLRSTFERFDDEPSSRDARALWRALSLSVWLEGVDSQTAAMHPPSTTH